jgi:PAS domain S-box-containing protein
MNGNKMSGDSQFQWESTVRRLIVCVAILCTFAPPVLYLLFSLGEQKISMEAEAHILAHTITDQINENPEYWQFEEIRFSSLLRHRLDKGNYLERRQLIDQDSKVVAESNDTLPPPLMSSEESVFDSGKSVGVLRITRSIREILQVSVFVLLLSSICGALVYYVQHVFPLRVLRSAFTALHAEKEQATVTLKSIADAVITTDTSLRIISVNPAASLMTGVNAASVKGELFNEHFRIFHPQTQENLGNLLEDCLYFNENRCSQQERVVFVRQSDGRAFQVELTVSPLYDENASLLGLVVVFHDVTASRELEKRLKDKALELSVIVKYASVGIVFVKGGVVRRVNALASEIVGLPIEEIIGQDVPSVLTSSLGYTGSLDNIYECLSQGGTFDIEHQIVRSDQRKIWLRLIGQAIDPARLREIGSVWIAQDITALKQQQDDLRVAKVHAEEASRFKSEFLADVSHELRSPLSGIIGLNRLVLETDIDDVQRRYLSIVQTSAETLLQLINNLLDLTKIEAGVMELEEKPFMIGSIYDYVQNVVLLRVKEKKLSLTFSCSDEIPGVLIGDELRLGQVLLNLVSNAIIFTSSGGIDVRCDMISQTDNRIKLSFKVIDTGCGIDETARKKIFDAFMQASISVARTHGGTGLGLSICKKLTDLMGGDITVESELGEGSTFTFTGWFTCKGSSGVKRDVVDEGAVLPVKATSRRPLRFLLVEDLPVNQTLVKLMLEREGHTIQMVSNGHEALIALAESTFDIIFMDVQMPVMDGLIATRLIRRCEKEENPLSRENKGLIKLLSQKIRGKHVPIIAMTGNATESGQSECFAAGMDNCICKPFERLEVLQAIEMVCEKFPLLSESHS